MSQTIATAPDRFLTVPNALCVIRLVASPLLIVLAWFEQSTACLALCVALLATDWVDGKIAKFLKQESRIGPWLDSIADAALFTCMLIAIFVLRGDLVRREAIWFAVALTCYLMNVVAGLIKFRRLPSYHTYLAKTAWWITAFAVTAVLLDWSPWFPRVAASAVALANLESLAITFILAQPRANVGTIWHVLK